jgi:hypothetical protein
MVVDSICLYGSTFLIFKSIRFYAIHPILFNLPGWLRTPDFGYLENR